MYFPFHHDNPDDPPEHHAERTAAVETLQRKTLLDLVATHRRNAQLVTSAQLHTAYWALKQTWLTVQENALVERNPDEIPMELREAGAHARSIYQLKEQWDARISGLMNVRDRATFEEQVTELQTELAREERLSQLDRVNIGIHLKNTRAFWQKHHDRSLKCVREIVAQNGYQTENPLILSSLSP